MIRGINNKLVRLQSGTQESTSVIPISNTILDYIYLPGPSLNASNGFVLTIRSCFIKLGTSNSYTIRLYTNTSNSFSGAVQLGVYTIPSNYEHTQFVRRLCIRGNEGIMMNTTHDQRNDYGDFATTTSTLNTTNWFITNRYFFVSVDAPGGRPTDTISSLYLTVEI
jgi:hypothetical protein